jgi:hypothetical protein
LEAEVELVLPEPELEPPEHEDKTSPVTSIDTTLTNLRLRMINLKISMKIGD